VNRARASAFAAALLIALAIPAATAPNSADVPPILIARQLAEQEHLSTGDIVTLAKNPRGTRARQFRVAGTYEPTPDPMRFTARRIEARMHLPDLMAISANPADPATPESLSAINLRLNNPKDAVPFGSALNARTPGLVVRPTLRARDGSDPFAVLERFHVAVATVTVLGSTAFLLALMVMRAEQRRDIIGILRLMGVSSRSILFEVLLEGLLIAVAGALFGVLLAVASQGVINRFFQWRFDTTLVFVRVTAAIAWKAVAFAVPLGVAAGLAASWTLLRRSVVSLVGR